MNKATIQKTFLPIFFIFILLNSIVVLLKSWLNEKNVDCKALFFTNALLFALTMFNLYLMYKALQKINPNVFVRTIMATAIIKLVLIGGGAFVYAYYFRQANKLPLLIVAMMLYTIYTVAELKAALYMNKNRNGDN